MLGERQSWRTVSYFFSDVFDLTFNVVGSTQDGGERIVRGSVEDKSFAVLYIGGERLRGAFLLDQSFVETKAAGALIANRSNISATKPRLSDPGFPLNRAAVQTLLVLQGGGALGAFECGVVKALEERSIHPDLVAGVSIGAFNAAIIAANPGNAATALEAFWRELSFDTPDIPNEDLRRAISSLQSAVFGAPRFFRARWFEPVLSPAQLPTNWTSFYDPSPLKATLSKYIEFEKLRDSPVRLLLTAVDVETGRLAVFDSYVDEITPEHILASGSLPPGFPWTTIAGKHYWDGGLVSNSPLDQVVELGGLTGKNVFVVNLWLGKRALPHSIPEVVARRDEIVLAEKTRRNIRSWEYIDDYRQLVEEIMASVEAKDSGADQTTAALHRDRWRGQSTVDHAHQPRARGRRIVISRLRVLTHEHRGAHRAGLCCRDENFAPPGQKGLSSWANNHYDRLPALASELVAKGVAVTVAGAGTAAPLAAKAATSTSCSSSSAKLANPTRINGCTAEL